MGAAPATSTTGLSTDHSHLPAILGLILPARWLSYATFALGTVLVAILGVATFILQSRTNALQNDLGRKQAENTSRQVILQQANDDWQRHRASVDWVVALTPVLGCTADARRDIALRLLEQYAPDQNQLVTAALERCPKTLPETQQSLRAVATRSALNAIAARFVGHVNNARQLLEFNLPGDAARVFNDASNSLPESYVARGIVALSDLTPARQAFAEGRFSDAADLFAHAFRKVQGGSTSGTQRPSR
jgi:hypothetical protein